MRSRKLRALNNLVLVTFATVGPKTPFRDYSEKVDGLKRFAESAGIDFKSFNHIEIASSRFNRYKNEYFKLRKGAGYWHWKPIVILEAIQLFPSSLILYVDVDVDFVKIEKHKLIQTAMSAPIHAFKTLDLIYDWTSTQCLTDLDPGLTYRKSYIYVAGIILVNPEFKATEYFLMQWMAAMDNEQSLLDPKNSLSRRHRHDQSIFSLLAAKETGIVNDLGPGFWGHGIKMPVIELENIWIGTSLSNFNLDKDKLKVSSYIRRAISIVRSFLDIRRYYRLKNHD